MKAYEVASSTFCEASSTLSPTLSAALAASSWARFCGGSAELLVDDVVAHLGTKDVFVDLVNDGFDLVLFAISAVRPEETAATHNDILLELVRLVLESRVLGENNLLDLASGLSDSLDVSGSIAADEQTNLDEVSGDILAMRGKSLELLNKREGKLLRRLKSGVSSSTKGRVDLGSSVDDVGEDGLSRLHPRGESLYH